MSILKKKEGPQTGAGDAARISKWVRYGLVVLGPLKQEKKKLMLAGGLMVISVGLQLPLALVTRYIIDDLLPNKNIWGLNLVILTLLGVMILKGLVDICQNYTISLARERIVANIQMRLLDHVQSLSLSFFWKSKAAYLSARISADSTNVANAVTNSLLPAIREVVTVVFATFMILIFQWKLGLASLAILPMFVVSLRLLSKRRKKCAEAYQESYAVACESLTELCLPQACARLTKRSATARDANCCDFDRLCFGRKRA